MNNCAVILNTRPGLINPDDPVARFVNAKPIAHDLLEIGGGLAAQDQLVASGHGASGDDTIAGKREAARVFASHEEIGRFGHLEDADDGTGHCLDALQPGDLVAHRLVNRAEEDHQRVLLADQQVGVAS